MNIQRALREPENGYIPAVATGIDTEKKVCGTVYPPAPTPTPRVSVHAIQSVRLSVYHFSLPLSFSLSARTL